jgi:hypothetical protein
LLMRHMDDYLFLTTDLAEVVARRRRWLGRHAVARRGPSSRLCMPASRSEASAPTLVPPPPPCLCECIDASACPAKTKCNFQSNIEGVQLATTLSWNGLLLDTASAELRADYSRLFGHGLRCQDSLTVRPPRRRRRRGGCCCCWVIIGRLRPNGQAGDCGNHSAASSRPSSINSSSTQCACQAPPLPPPLTWPQNFNSPETAALNLFQVST